MLVLSRRPDERIVIRQGSHTIVVSVLGIDGGRVRLGIAAPDNVPVQRQEVWQRQSSGPLPPNAGQT